MRHRLLPIMGICLLATHSVQAARQCGAGFAPPVSLPGFNFASAVASADFNRDGRRDLVVANTGVGSISVLLGNGSGGFTTHATYPSGTYPGSMAVGDFNRDGFDDVAVPNEGSGNVRVFLGTGTGALTSLGLVPAGASPRAVRTADFNRDGKLDLAVVNTSSATVTVSFGVGDGTFPAPVSFAVPNGPWSLTVADINLDGWPDLLVPSLGSGTNVVTILLGQSSGSPATAFQPAVTIPTGNSPSGVAVGDLNRDGLPDLVVSNTGGANVSVHRATAPGVFGAGKTDYLAGNGPNAVRLADFNGDGLLDVVVSNESDDGVNVLYGNGNATLQPRAFFPAGDGSRNLEVADFNADGRPDLAVPNVSSNDVAILLGFNGTTSYSSFPVTGSTFSTGGDTPFGVASGDLNRDGKPDLVVTNQFGNSFGVLLGSGGGAFQSVATYPVPSSPNRVTLADLNGDGMLDAAVASRSGAVTIFTGNGSGGFSPAVSYPTPAGTSTVVTLDFNRDGLLDLAAINDNGLSYSLLTNTGAGAFSVSTASLPVGPASIASGDFDRDGNADIAIGYNGAAELLILRGNGAGGFVPAPIAVPSAVYRSLQAADLNLDGKLDLIAATNTGNFIFIGNGNGTFLPPQIDAAPPTESPMEIAVADFNADGKPDYVGTYFLGMMVTRRGDGNGGFTNDGGYSPGSQPRGIAIADFTGDGRLDLAVVRSTANNIIVLPNMAPFRPEVALTASTLTPALGQPVTFTATVTAGSTACEVPTGNVYFQAGATGLGTVPLNGAGVASVTTSALPLGPVSVVAAYRGDAQFHPRESAQLSVTTTSPATTTTVTSSLNPSQFGQTVTFTIQVSGSNGVPTGTVTLRNGATTLATRTLSAQGTASFSTSGLETGTHSITAAYSGDALNAMSTSAVLTQTVNPAPSDASIITSLDSAPAGRSVTLVSNPFVRGNNATGTVTFRDGSTVLGTVTVSTRMRATLHVSNLSQGSHWITASYSGDSNHLPSTSPNWPLLITAPEPLCAVPLSNPVNYPSGEASHVTSGDLNADGRPDLAVANQLGNSISVLLAAPGGGFLPAVAYPTGTSPRASAIGDFDRDGTPDLVTVGLNSLNYHRGVGNGTFAAATSVSLGHSTGYWIAAADLNTDGKLDLILDAEPNVAVRLGNGDGSFQPPQFYAATNGGNLGSFAVADLNGDGKHDIAIGETATSSVRVLTGDGLGGFSAATAYPAGGGGAHAVTVGDFNKDGIPDLAVVNSLNLAILTGTGMANPNAFGPPATYTAGPKYLGARSAVSADFNGDGSLDIVVPNWSGQTVSLFRGNGDGTFQADVNFSTGASPRNAAVADFNGDGKPDIAVSNSYSDYVSLLTGSGSSGVPAITLTSAPNPSLYNSTVTLTATLAGQGACGLPSGTVTFQDGGVTLGTANLNSGTATLSTPSLAVGTHSLTAVYSGDTNYLGSTSAAVSHVVNSAPQTIVFGPLPARTFGHAPFAVTATGGASGQPVTFTASGNCTVSGNIVTITGAGSCSVTASQLGNANYLPATPVTQSFTIAKAAATLSFVPASLLQLHDGTPRIVSVTTTPVGLSGVVVTYDGQPMAPINAGSYAVTATLTNANYSASPITGLLTVSAPVTTTGGGTTATSTVGSTTITSSFSNVTNGGTVTVTPISPLDAASTPGGFVISGANLAFDISTTATFQGAIVNCFHVPAISSEAEFNNLRVLHREVIKNNPVTYGLVDVTILSGQYRPNYATRTICARTTSLSPFYLVTVVDRTPPTVADVALSQNPLPAGTPVTLTASITDAGAPASNLSLAEYSLDGGANWTAIAADYHASTSMNVSVQFTPPVGVYAVCVRGSDGAQNQTVTCGPVLAVYDPNGGFVTGGGWIDSPAGAFPADPAMTGKANFGFSSKYEQGANVPTGDTQFRFHAAGMQFKSTSHEWLVVAGARAQFKGVGTVNGVPGFGFLLTAIDGQQNGGGGKDRFRIKIWNIANEVIVYDNQIGKSEQGNDATELGGGSIIIHKP